ncbi:hypothetical protein [Nostoc sp. ATCC 53789]|uniref:hypothetical protein n=1 Tax=Nostoc sp. ATCC 53789 TaxID=76335 RepID=UPI000DED265A|nr:hypothetical protein [Nostoc sp. ATCC 53789]QHG17181.1 hypothetical protein GJB62_15180 [Nostoc sp. ATCC 53789]RCJ34988.1 hypothetical protein A6V25_33525 [Nostoc sp. ATCC 53789]
MRLLFLKQTKEKYPDVHEGIFSERFGQLILNSIGINLIVFDEQLERIIRWITGLTQLAQCDRNFIVFTYYVKVAYLEDIAEINNSN